MRRYRSRCAGNTLQDGGGRTIEVEGYDSVRGRIDRGRFVVRDVVQRCGLRQ